MIFLVVYKRWFQYKKRFLHKPAVQASVFCGARTGHTLTHMLHSVQVSLSTVTTSLIMLMAITGHKSMHPPHPVHLLVSIVTILYPFPAFYYASAANSFRVDPSIYQAEGL